MKGKTLRLVLCTTYNAPPRGPEYQVLDYQTQQMKLLPLLASAYALIQTGQYMIREYARGRSEIAQGNLDVLPEVCGI